MDGNPARGRRWEVLVPAAVLAGLVLMPYGTRLRAPSLYADDVERVRQLQEMSPGAVLLAPFNEHVAPLFQAVSWATWQAAGRRLAWAPAAFTVVSSVPFVLTLGLLARVLRRATGSPGAAGAGVAVFGASWLAVETVYWYSASSFMWALLATLAAWEATGAGSKSGSFGAGLAAAAAPMFSMVGVLAGPVAAVRALMGGGGRSRSWARAAAPVAGTALYLAGYAAGAGHGAGGAKEAGVLPGLIAAARAPMAALVPAVFGVRTLPHDGTAGVALGAAGVVAAGVLGVWAWRQRSAEVAGGLVLIAGGYALAFCARAGDPGRDLIETQRYHLFPMLGLVFVLVPVLRRGFRRWDARPAAGVWAAAALAAALGVVHQREMRGRAHFLRFPDQPATLAALDAVTPACERLGVTRAQAVAALKDTAASGAAWLPAGYPAAVMLGPGAEVSRVPDARVRATLLAALSPAGRGALCGGMDVSPFLVREAGPSGPALAGRLVGSYRVRTGEGGRRVAAGWPAFLEYEYEGTIDPGGPAPTALDLAADPAGAAGEVELWWRGDGERWSPGRSVRIRSEPGARSVRLPLAAVPHWDPTRARWVRLLFRQPGPVALEGPRVVR